MKAVLTGDDAREAGFKSLPNVVNYPGQRRPVAAQGALPRAGASIAYGSSASRSRWWSRKRPRQRKTPETSSRSSTGIFPPWRTFDAAVAPGAPQLHAGVPGNLAFEYESGDEAATAAAFARAKYVSKLVMDSQRLVGNMLEPRACLVAHDAASGRYTFHVPLQGIGGMRGQIAAVSGVDKDKIVIATQDVGGSFGVRGPAYPGVFRGDARRAEARAPGKMGRHAR